jgi:hypothetical protein
MTAIIMNAGLANVIPITLIATAIATIVKLVFYETEQALEASFRGLVYGVRAQGRVQENPA